VGLLGQVAVIFAGLLNLMTFAPPLFGAFQTYHYLPLLALPVLSYKLLESLGLLALTCHRGTVFTLL
jgi:hypothetical protein